MNNFFEILKRDYYITSKKKVVICNYPVNTTSLDLLDIQRLFYSIFHSIRKININQKKSIFIFIVSNEIANE